MSDVCELNEAEFYDCLFCVFKRLGTCPCLTRDNVENSLVSNDLLLKSLPCVFTDDYRCTSGDELLPAAASKLLNLCFELHKM